jgi:hypothetical protein
VVRRAEGRDMEALLTIEQQCFNVYYYDYYMLDRRDFEFYLQDVDGLFFVAVQGSRVVGYVLGPVDLWRDPPSAHIDIKNVFTPVCLMHRFRRFPRHKFPGFVRRESDNRCKHFTKARY